MTLALSTFGQYAGVGAFFVLVLALRLFGRWLIGRGGSMEARRHGPLPGGSMDPGISRASEQESPPASAPDRYDPFNADP